MAQQGCPLYYDPTTIAGAYSNIAIVLAGFAIAALVLLAQRTPGQGELLVGRMTAKEIGGFLFLALVMLILAAIMMAVTAGETTSGGILDPSTRMLSMVGLGAMAMGLAISFLVLGVILLVQAHGLTSSPFLAVSTFLLFAVVICGLLVLTADDMRTDLSNSCGHPADETAALIVLAVVPGLAVWLMPTWRRSPLSFIEDPRMLWGIGLLFTASLGLLFPWVASQDDPAQPTFSLHRYYWFAMVGIGSLLLGWQLRMLEPRAASAMWRGTRAFLGVNDKGGDVTYEADSSEAVKREPESFRSVVEGLRAQLVATFPEPRDPATLGWLQSLHSIYAARFEADNGRVWTTASILATASFATFAGILAIDDPELPHVFVLGGISGMLLGVWVVIAENYRAFQWKSLAWQIAIEEFVGFEDKSGFKIADGKWNRLLVRTGAVQTLRASLLAAVLIGWTLIGVWIEHFS